MKFNRVYLGKDSIPEEYIFRKLHLAMGADSDYRVKNELTEQSLHGHRSTMSYLNMTYSLEPLTD